jgi:hypothetical protein
VSATPLLVAPAVAVIVAELNKRPLWAVGTPFVVAAELYAAASDEMAKILRKRGYPPSLSAEYVRRGVPHFLVLGTPIVSNG